MPSSNNDLLRYAGLTTQIFVALGLAVYLGLKLDKWLSLSFPLSVLILPLAVIVAMMYKLLKETNRKK
ncbi:MAG: AtpZ/AtpI family protein [Chitinophagaceae bacterium]